jgi:hypothetical protein
MPPRTQWTEPERHDRSQLAKLIHQDMLLAGSLVTMARTCGKANCKCQRGHKHVSLYLSIRVGQQRKLIYVPSSLEPVVRAAVQTYQQAQKLTARVSQACLRRFLAAKAQQKQSPTTGAKRASKDGQS